MTSDKPVPAIQLTGLGSTAENVSEIFSNQPAASGTSYGNIFSILKVMRLFRLGRVARALHRFWSPVLPSFFSCLVSTWLWPIGLPVFGMSLAWKISKQVSVMVG